VRALAGATLLGIAATSPPRSAIHPRLGTTGWSPRHDGAAAFGVAALLGRCGAAAPSAPTTAVLAIALTGDALGRHVSRSGGATSTRQAGRRRRHCSRSSSSSPRSSQPCSVPPLPPPPPRPHLPAGLIPPRAGGRGCGRGGRPSSVTSRPWARPTARGGHPILVSGRACMRTGGRRAPRGPHVGAAALWRRPRTRGDPLRRALGRRGERAAGV
jgi:hypothetical protein